MFPRRLIVVCRRFGTLYQFHLQGLDVHPALEDGTDRGFRNVGIQQSDAGETPKRIHNRFKTRRKFEIKKEVGNSNEPLNRKQERFVILTTNKYNNIVYNKTFIYKKLSCKRELGENELSGSHTLLLRVNTFLSVLHTFIVTFGSH